MMSKMKYSVPSIANMVRQISGSQQKSISKVSYRKLIQKSINVADASFMFSKLSN